MVLWVFGPHTNSQASSLPSFLLFSFVDTPLLMTAICKRSTWEQVFSTVLYLSPVCVHSELQFTENEVLKGLSVMSLTVQIKWEVVICTRIRGTTASCLTEDENRRLNITLYVSFFGSYVIVFTVHNAPINIEEMFVIHSCLCLSFGMKTFTN